MLGGKQDATYCVMFVIVCDFKFSNLTKSYSIKMIELAPGSLVGGKLDATSSVMFVLVCGPKFSDLAKFCLIELVQLATGSM